jgi:hypothetical protein
VQGIFLNTGDSAMNKTKLFSWSLTVSKRRQKIKIQVSIICHMSSGDKFFRVHKEKREE